MDMAAMLNREITLESDAARKVRSHASDDRTDFLNEGKKNRLFVVKIFSLSLS